MEVIRLKDMTGREYSVIDDASPERPSIYINGYNGGPAGPLDQESVKKLIPILQRFVETGEVVELSLAKRAAKLSKRR